MLLTRALLFLGLGTRRRKHSHGGQGSVPGHIHGWQNPPSSGGQEPCHPHSPRLPSPQLAHREGGGRGPESPSKVKSPHESAQARAAGSLTAKVFSFQLFCAKPLSDPDVSSSPANTRPCSKFPPNSLPLFNHRGSWQPGEECKGQEAELGPRVQVPALPGSGCGTLADPGPRPPRPCDEVGTAGRILKERRARLAHPTRGRLLSAKSGVHYGGYDGNYSKETDVCAHTNVHTHTCSLSHTQLPPTPLGPWEAHILVEDT